MIKSVAWNVQALAFAKIISKDLPKNVASFRIARISNKSLTINGSGHLQVSLPCPIDLEAESYLSVESLKLPVKYLSQEFEKDFNGDDFVKPIDVLKIKMQPVDRDLFLRAMADCLTAVRTDETRYYLCGIAFDGSRAIATDGHRLVSRVSGLVRLNSSALIVPALTISAFQLALKYAPDDAPVTIGFSDTAVHFKVGDIQVRSRLIDGTYPDWRRVVPINKVPHTFTINREKAIWACKLATQLDKAEGVKKLTTILIGNGFVSTINNKELATLEPESNASYSVRLDARYVLDALQCVDADMVDIRGEDAGSPHMFVPKGQDPSYDSALVVMPHRR